MALVTCSAEILIVVHRRVFGIHIGFIVLVTGSTLEHRVR